MITSTPAGAAVIVNGKDTGRTTPATLANLEPGRYEVLLAMNGYENWKETFDVGAQQSIPVDTKLKQAAAPPETLKPVEEKPPTTPVMTPPPATAAAGKGTLHVTSAPPGAWLSPALLGLYR